MFKPEILQKKEQVLQEFYNEFFKVTGYHVNDDDAVLIEEKIDDAAFICFDNDTEYPNGIDGLVSDLIESYLANDFSLITITIEEELNRQILENEQRYIDRYIDEARGRS